MTDLALNIQQLHKVYDNGHVGLKGIDLQVHKGDFFALLGPNGAGKSTTIGIITSLVNKTSGQVSVFGHDIDTDNLQAKAKIGVVPQEVNANIFHTPEQVLITQAGFYGVRRHIAEARAEHYLKRLGLWEKRRSRVRMLSGGMKRRLMIARALMNEPALLILDEPTAGVDIELRRTLWAFVQEINAAGTTIILTTHYLEEAESLCKHVAIINHGEIVADTDVKTLLKQHHVQTLLVDLCEPLTETPVLPIADIQITLTEPQLLTLTIPQSMCLNDLFSALDAAGIKVSGLRNKTNRLEETFLSLVTNKLSDQTSGPNSNHRPATGGAS